MKKLLVDCGLEQITQIIKQLNQPSYRATQLFDWINLGCDYGDMSNLPKSLIASLETEYDVFGMQIKEVFESKDGSKKYLFELRDGNLIESVFMPHDYGSSVCVSTQVGCRMRCAFCASGIDGLIRNLTSGEILAQVLLINRDAGGNKSKREVKNIVLMGSGEPLDNYDNVIGFLSLVTNERGINISVRNISLSTSGLVGGIDKLSESGFTVTLSISLHATTDEMRNELMPISKKYTTSEVISSAKRYFEKTGRRVIIEYIMLKDNTDYFDAKRLSTLLKGFACHVNLIPLNSTPNTSIIGADPNRCERFLDRLTKENISATIRKSMGTDIQGACGQLRRKFVGDLDSKNSPK